MAKHSSKGLKIKVDEHSSLKPDGANVVMYRDGTHGFALPECDSVGMAQDIARKLTDVYRSWGWKVELDI